MHILVTGATGFIGAHFVKLALSEGHHVTALRHNHSSSPVIAWPKQPSWIDGSLSSINAKQLEGVNAIAHFAAVGVSPRTASWNELEDVNIRSTLHLCQLAKEIGARIVIAGSFVEYGLSGNRYKYIPASAPLEPLFPYAASKAAASVLATSYARSERTELAYLRIFNAFGEGQNQSNLWPSMRHAVRTRADFPLTPGEQVRDFVDVDIVARCFLQSLATLCIRPGSPLIANIGSGKPQTIRDFCSYWWAKWNAPGKLLIGAIPYRAHEVMRSVPELTPGLFF